MANWFGDTAQKVVLRVVTVLLTVGAVAAAIAYAVGETRAKDAAVEQFEHQRDVVEPALRDTMNDLLARIDTLGQTIVALGDSVVTETVYRWLPPGDIPRPVDRPVGGQPDAPAVDSAAPAPRDSVPVIVTAQGDTVRVPLLLLPTLDRCNRLATSCGVLVAHATDSVGNHWRRYADSITAANDAATRAMQPDFSVFGLGFDVGGSLGFGVQYDLLPCDESESRSSSVGYVGDSLVVTETITRQTCGSAIGVGPTINASLNF